MLTSAGFDAPNTVRVRANTVASIEAFASETFQCHLLYLYNHYTQELSKLERPEIYFSIHRTITKLTCRP